MNINRALESGNMKILCGALNLFLIHEAKAPLENEDNFLDKRSAMQSKHKRSSDLSLSIKFYFPIESAEKSLFIYM